MPELATPPRPASVKSAPSAVAPADGALVDAHLLTFEWTDSDAETYFLELASDPAFVEIVCRVPAGSSTSATAYDLFPANGARFFWRVLAQSIGGSRVASETRSFVAVNANAAVSQPKETVAVRRAREPIVVAERMDAVEVTPYHTGHTSAPEMTAIAILMILSFVLTVAYLFHLSMQF